MSSIRTTESFNVANFGLDIVPSANWYAEKEEDKVQDQNVKEINFDSRVMWLKEYLINKPIAALSYLRGDPEGQYRGIMLGDESVDENIVIAYLVAWNATRKEKTKSAVFRYICMHWQPLFIQIQEARTQVDQEKKKQDWAQEKWTEPERLSDGMTRNAIKAAAAFFQKAFSHGVNLENDPYSEDDSEDDSETGNPPKRLKYA